LFPKGAFVAGLTARQYDAHYRRLGLTPGVSPFEIDEAATKLKEKLRLERFKSGPLKEIAPIRLAEIEESTVLLIGYWQRYNAAPPSIQNQSRGVALGLSSQSTQTPTAFKEEKTAPTLMVEERVRFDDTALSAIESETGVSLVESIGPEQPKLSFTYSLFRAIEGGVSPTADVFRPLSIVGLIALAFVWVATPIILVKILSIICKDYGMDTWLEYFALLAKVIPICFVPPFVIYEYAFFRQLQFPFVGAVRLPVEQAIDSCVQRLTVESIGNSAGWTVESKEMERSAGEVLSGEVVASYTGTNNDKGLPLKIHMRIEKLSQASSFIVYWFELDWNILFKGRAVSRMKSARFEIDRLIKES
jgi:hypothetical protein